MPKKKDVKIETDNNTQKNKSIINAAISPLWTDALTFGVREDNICMLTFLAQLPEGRLEQARVMTSSSSLKIFLDLICSSLDYYPEKKKDPE